MTFYDFISNTACLKSFETSMSKM